MEYEYRRLAEMIRKRARAHHKPRLLVAVAGIPGSGKTTTAQAVVRRLNEDPDTHATLLPMDGFHLPRAALDQLPDPKLAHIRRGAPYTFDVSRFVDFARQLRAWADEVPLATPSSATWSAADMLAAPSFDHKVKDPVENSIFITPETSIIIIEGNYLLLDEPGWRDLADLVDYRIFVDLDLDEARERVAKRHVQAGIEKTLEDGFRRVDSNDYLNAIWIRDRLLAPDIVVKSVSEEAGLSEIDSLGRDV